MLLKSSIKILLTLYHSCWHLLELWPTITFKMDRQADPKRFWTQGSSTIRFLMISSPTTGSFCTTFKLLANIGHPYHKEVFQCDREQPQSVIIPQTTIMSGHIKDSSTLRGMDPKRGSPLWWRLRLSKRSRTSATSSQLSNRLAMR